MLVTNDQGCYYLNDVKFKDFSKIFQDFFTEIQDLLYQLRPDHFTHFLKQTLVFGITELVDPDNEKQPMVGHSGQNLGLAKLRPILFYSAAVSKIVTLRAYF